MEMNLDKLFRKLKISPAFLFLKIPTLKYGGNFQNILCNGTLIL